MSIKQKIKGLAIQTLLSPGAQRARAAALDVGRRVRGAERTVDFYFDLTDPHSYLLAQAVSRIAGRYPVEWAFHFITQPGADVDPAPALRRPHAHRDAQEQAALWDVEFVAKREMDPGLTRKASQILIKDRPFAAQLAAAIEVAGAAWAGNGKRVGELMLELGSEASGSIAPVTNANYQKLREKGHYQGAMLGYGGDWYWGIDRLPYLEQRLQEELGTGPLPPAVSPRPASERPPERLAPGDAPPPLELFYSFRSPYSYLALAAARALAERHGLTLRLRPVAPMVNRGMPLAPEKRLYIARDAKREADRLGIPFGRLCDPLGKGVDHCLAIAHAVRDAGQDVEFALSAGRGIWAEARDVADYVDLRTIVERAGITWETARAALASDGWREAIEQNQADLALIGLWGVPSFRFGRFVTWGQDRLGQLEDRIRRHLVAPPLPAATAPAPAGAG
jgi:2-hydroxychromene-2-carboxylate isomerase